MWPLESLVVATLHRRAWLEPADDFASHALAGQFTQVSNMPPKFDRTKLVGGGLWMEIGGAEGDRTPDLCNAIAALSQLSYGPEIRKMLADFYGRAFSERPAARKA
jgi:hypothetical protein